MAYNNGFPIGYQNPYYPQQYYSQYSQPVQQPIATPMSNNSQPQNNGMIWVQGIGGAKSYLVGPNATVVLWDSEAPVIYLKSADASGMPTMKTLDYVIRDDQPSNSALSITKDNIQVATKDDISVLRAELDQVKDRLNSLSSYSNRKDNRKEYKNEQSSV